MAKRKKTDYESDLALWLKEPGNAARYLIDIISDDSDGLDDGLILGLRDVVSAFGFTEIARRSGVNRQHLYRMLNGKAVPRISTLKAILSSVGAQLSITSLTESVAEENVQEQAESTSILHVDPLAHVLHFQAPLGSEALPSSFMQNEAFAKLYAQLASSYGTDSSVTVPAEILLAPSAIVQMGSYANNNQFAYAA